MKKILIPLFLVFIVLFSLIVLAKEEPYTTGDKIPLPQFESITPLDTQGIERTYLFCTWHIGQEGQEAIEMNSQLCPTQSRNYTVRDDDHNILNQLNYAVRIDFVHIHFNGTDWNIENSGLSGQFFETFALIDIPEPPDSFFDDIIEDIINNIQNWLCLWFGIFCD